MFKIDKQSMECYQYTQEELAKRIANRRNKQLDEEHTIQPDDPDMRKRIAEELVKDGWVSPYWLNVYQEWYKRRLHNE